MSITDVPSAPRWIEVLSSIQAKPENIDQNIYQIATVDAEGAPHVRSHMHRGILYPIDSPDRPVILTSTDVRTPKVTQMLHNMHTELVWHFNGTQEQLRIAGFAHIVPTPSNPTFDSFEPSTYLDLSKFEKQGFDWEKKRKEVWSEMSPQFRAMWCTPDPGTHLSSFDEAKTWPTSVPNLGEAKTPAEKKAQEMSLSNFALVIIEPVEVDWVTSSVFPNRRIKWSRQGSSGNWKEEILVP